MSENVHWPTATPVAPAVEQTEYFAVSTPKFVVMSIFTVGLYELYWAYKQWKTIKARTGADIMPFWRAFFSGLWGFSLFGQIKADAERRAIGANWSAGLLGALYLVLLVTWRLPDPWWLVSLLSFLPMLPVVQTVERINNAPAHLRNDKYSGANIAGIIVGPLVLALAVLGMTIDPETEDITAPPSPNRASRAAPRPV